MNMLLYETEIIFVLLLSTIYYQLKHTFIAAIWWQYLWHTHFFSP